MSESSVGAAFRSLRSSGKAAFMPFFVACDPTPEASRDLILAAVKAGADLVEIGVPFSDPIADGPVIQAAYARVLDRGFKVRQFFALVRSLRDAGATIPIVCMASHSLVHKRGAPEFFAEAKSCGVDAMVIPDLPAGYEGAVLAQATSAGLDLVFLAAPTTTPERRKVIAANSRGFIYCVASTGLTGVRSELPPELAEHVRSIKALTTTPVCVGFGISTPQQAATVAREADGVIVGSALVRQINELHSKSAPLSEMVASIGAACEQLASAAHTKKAD